MKDWWRSIDDAIGAHKLNKLTEPYWAAWLFWHLYRKRKGPRYRTFWEFRQFVRALPADGLMVDCGANIGDVSKLFLDKGWMVHAFEPDPDARAALQNRFRGRGNLIVHPQAVSDKAGRLLLHRSSGVSPGNLKQSISSSLVSRNVHSGDNAVEVEVVDLFAFMDSLERPVDVLKLDVEGAEVQILEKMLSARYDRKIGYVLAETHQKFSAEFAQRLKAIRSRVAELDIENINLDWE